MKKTLLILFFWGMCISLFAQESGGDSKKTNTNTGNKTKTDTYKDENTSSSTTKMKPWDWKDFRMKFQIPEDFKVTQSDATTFIAENGNINLSIYPRKGEQLTHETMESSLITWAEGNNVTDYEQANFMANLNGYEGYYIDGKVGDFPTSLLLLSNPKSPENSLYIWLSYAQSEFETAVEILKSFKPF